MKECDGCRIKHQKIMELNEQIAVQKGMLEDYQKENKFLSENQRTYTREEFDEVLKRMDGEKQARSRGRDEAVAEIENVVLHDIMNPYPIDVFEWGNKEKLDFNRGRFNQFCHETFENFRTEVLEELASMKKEVGKT